MVTTNTPISLGKEHAVGKVFILYGTVKALGRDGFERLLQPNSPIFADDRIVTGPDGRISILFDLTDSRLDLGRMSESTIDPDVYGGTTPEETAEQFANVEKIHGPLVGPEPDPTTEVETPGTGDEGPVEGGGGRHYFLLEADSLEVTPTSGAETYDNTMANEPTEVESPTDNSAGTVEPTLTIQVEDSGPTAGGDPPSANEGGQTILVEDTAPTAVDDTASVSEGGDTISGDLLENDSSHEGVTVTAITYNGVSFEVGKTYSMDGGKVYIDSIEDTTGTYASALEEGEAFLFNSEGTYEYTSRDDAYDHSTETLSAVFGYTVEDNDGDTDNATLTIGIEDSTPTAVDDTVSVIEDGTTSGNLLTNDTDSADGNITVTSITYNGRIFEVDVQYMGLWGSTILIYPDGSTTVDNSLSLDEGESFIFSSDGTYTYYPRTDGFDHSADTPPSVEFTYTIQDEDGSTAEGTLTIGIEDTAPTAVDDTASVTEGGETTSGDLLANDTPADNAAVTSITYNGVTFEVGKTYTMDGGQVYIDSIEDTTGTYAGALEEGETFLFNSDGTYEYTSRDDDYDYSSGDTHIEQFHYTVTDNDGDTDNAVLTIGIEDDRAVPESGGTAKGYLLDNDSNNDGAVVTSVTYNGVTFEVDVTYWNLFGEIFIIYQDGSYIQDDSLPLSWGEKFIFNNDGTYEYRSPNEAYDHSVESPTAVFDYTVEYTDGSSADGILTLDIEDTVPIAEPDFDSVTEGQTTTGYLLVNDDHSGDDDYEVTAITYQGLTYTVDTTHTLDNGESFTFYSNGAYVYTSRSDGYDHSGETPSVEFGYTIQDTDGSTAESTLTIEIEDAAPAAADFYGHIANEQNLELQGTLPDYGPDGAGYADLSGNVAGWTQDTINFADSGYTSSGLAVYYYVDPNDLSTLIATTDPSDPSDEGSYVFTLHANPENGEYTLSTSSALDDGGADIITTFTVEVYDGDGSSATTSIQVEFDGNNSMTAFTDEGEVFVGGGDDETIVGGGGDDIIDGGEGEDTLTGGEGADSFIVWGTETITDYDGTMDTLILPPG